MGATATGKTALAEAVARTFDAQLINADAFQVYRGFDIGTAKPADRSKYRLLDIRDARESFGVGEYVLLAQAELRQLYDEGRSAVLVGGSGLYTRALMEEYSSLRPEPDPRLRAELRARLSQEGLSALAEELRRRDPARARDTDLSNPVRVLRALEHVIERPAPLPVELPPLRKLKVVLDLEPEELIWRIDHRIGQMVQNGWVDEVARLRREGIGPDAPAARAIGYRGMFEHVAGNCTLEEAIQTAAVETRQYAKRQRTWLRSEPNVQMILDAAASPEGLEQAVASLLDDHVG